MLLSPSHGQLAKHAQLPLRAGMLCMHVVPMQPYMHVVSMQLCMHAVHPSWPLSASANGQKVALSIHKPL
jgi:hypothetical protein